MARRGPQPYTRERAAQRFWQRVSKKGPNDCWLWRGSCASSGYGMVNFRGLFSTPVYTHRFAWILAKGSIPAGKHVLHKCDNRPCCNPRHLFLGTQQDNNKDRDRKGRVASGDRNGSRTHPENVARGERNGISKLTAREVRAMRKMRSRGYTQRELANWFKISQQQVHMVVSRKHWKHI